MHPLLPKLSHHVQDPYAAIQCKQTTSDLLGPSRHVYNHQNTARKTGTRIKRRHRTPPLSSFAVRHAKVTFLGLSRKVEVMGAMPTVQIAANVVAPYEKIQKLLQTCPLPD
ncbi:hypothetical protein TNCV_898911 [Trichonephila clavipes]|nr:hypothetical protein TNCV_898911 [Trichonephila clavipes]